MLSCVPAGRYRGF